jgi:hypothetical protein
MSGSGDDQHRIVVGVDGSEGSANALVPGSVGCWTSPI